MLQKIITPTKAYIIGALTSINILALFLLMANYVDGIQTNYNQIFCNQVNKKVGENKNMDLIK